MCVARARVCVSSRVFALCDRGARLPSSLRLASLDSSAAHAVVLPCAYRCTGAGRIAAVFTGDTGAATRAAVRTNVDTDTHTYTHTQLGRDSQAVTTLFWHFHVCPIDGLKIVCLTARCSCCLASCLFVCLSVVHHTEGGSARTPLLPPISRTAFLRGTFPIISIRI